MSTMYVRVFACVIVCVGVVVVGMCHCEFLCLCVHELTYCIVCRFELL